jgi:hypothetical protein
MRYEKKSEPLAPAHVYYKRIAVNLAWVSIILAIMLVIGTVGYHYATTTNTGWLDAFHNSSMILSGMGPVIVDGFTAGGKIFSSFYALFSGIVFVGAMGFILAPGLHRIFHKLHIQEK